MSAALIAVIDIGKTNARVSFVDTHSGGEIWSARRANRPVATAFLQQLDVAGIEQWLLGALREAPLRQSVRAIVPMAHGAAAVLLDTNLQFVAAPDYEDPRFERIDDDYSRERDPFARTFSPGLPLGLNLGRQLFYLEQLEPALFARVAHIVPYPQYWAWRFSNVLASELTSLGCHTDLWRPQEMCYSGLARAHGWSHLLPATRFAGDTLGPITVAMARATGLDAQCRVICGIHDSNASYLQHLIERPREQPFTVVSSGTWTVVMAKAVDLSCLRSGRDMLANVDAFGSPVATARFMGGREYERICGSGAMPEASALARVLQLGALAVPSFAPGGPFADHAGSIEGAHDLNETELATLAVLYSALMTDLLLDDLQSHGDIIVDGPLAADPLFASVLATLRGNCAVYRKTGSAASASSGCYLAGFKSSVFTPPEVAHGLELPQLERYRQLWRNRLPAAKA